MTTADVQLAAPASKSVTHRAFILAAAAAPCRVESALLGADCRSTLDVLRGLGAEISVEAPGTVTFHSFAARAPAEPLDCGNSGTTLRLMTGQATRWEFEVTLTGDDSLRSRPNGQLLEALARLGVRVASRDGRAPLTVRGPLRAGEVRLPGGLSSQYTSSLILALALTEGRSTISVARPVASRPYLDLTADVARSFGLELEVREDEEALTFVVPGGQRPSADVYAVEADWSGAAFPIVGAAITGQRLALSGLRRDSLQGDRAIAPIVESYGCGVSWDGDDLRVEPGPLRSPGAIGLGQTPDMFPALCVLAAAAEGTTTLHGSPGLRHKECDRIAAMAQGLTRLGVACEELDDGLIVHGGPAHAGAVRSHHDHRIHMAFAILGLVSEGAVDIDHPECAAVSYPDFHAHLAALRGAR